jgi:hypothetical protein
MKILKELDLTGEKEQLRRVIQLRDSRDPRHTEALDTLHRMLAKKTLEYYGADGYDAFFHTHRLDYETDDGYAVKVRGHDMTVRVETTYGIVTGSGSTWDYLPDDLAVSRRPQGMNVTAYDAVKKRMRALEDAERIVYPFHPLHRLGNGYFDTKICMYNAHILLKNHE